MLKGIWPSRSNDEGANSVAGSTATPGTISITSSFGMGNRKQRLQQAGLALRAKHLLEFEHESTDGRSTVVSRASSSAATKAQEINDDEQANRLLVQFPTYGSHSQALNSNNLNQTADWLLGGTSNIPNPSQQQQLMQKQQEQIQQQQQQEQIQQQQQQQQNQMGLSQDNFVLQQQGTYNDDEKQRLDSKAVHRLGEEWDEDEQKLWKNSNLAWFQNNRRPSHSIPNGMKDSSANGDGNDNKQGQSNKLEDPSQDWLHAYYYHTGVTPKKHSRNNSSAFEHFAAARNPPNSFTSRASAIFSPGEKHGNPASITDDEDGHPHTGMQPPPPPPPPPPPMSRTTNINTNNASRQRRPPSPDQLINNEVVETPRKSLTALAFSSEPNRSSQSISDDRQHWMPDQLCKHCYACDTPFTVFRRRHHCRLCGQVFCNSCSAFFVPANQSQQQNLQHQSQQQPQSQLHQSHGAANNSSTGSISSNIGKSSGGTGGHNSGALNTSNHNGNNKTILRTCKMCFEQVTAQQQQIVEGEAAAETGRKRKKKGEEALSPAIDLTHKVSNPTQGSSPQQVMLGVSPSLQDQLDQADSVLHSLSNRRKETPYGKRRLLSQQQAMEQEEKEATRLLQHHQQRLHHQQESARATKLLPPVSSPVRAPQKQNLPIDSRNQKASTMAKRDRRLDAEEGNRHLGLTAAAHLEKMGELLLDSDAPLLWDEVAKQIEASGDLSYKRKWISKIMSLLTRCCATVEPNVKNGDLLDIRPFCKIKVIPGGTYQDCAYVSGVVFRKTLSHKRMAKEISNPRIMLLSGGIEFTRTENRIASLETLMEQEGKYMEILVGKILKLKPDVLMVGRSVSRRAQELLLKAKVVLLQHVKGALLSRVSRQTGATIISSTDHIMNQFGAHVLGKCHRFRFIVARDNEVWVDDYDDKGSETDSSIDFQPFESKAKRRRNIKALLADPGLSNHERQSVLAASVLGQEVLDGYEAVRCGLSKRGVAQTYVMLEGCPKHLGCTVILRGASQAALKQVKVVFRFLVNVAYNLKLERNYWHERCARLRPDFEIKPCNLFSSSLCVDYGKPAGCRRIRPWNGGSNQNEVSHRSISGKVTAFDHQSILITSVWMTDKTQCCPAEVKGICYYSLQDVSLGQFLRDSCFNLSLKCQNPTCKKSVLDHSLSFVHNDGLINITVDHMDDPLPPAPLDGSRKVDESSKDDEEDSEEIEDSPIATWTYCKVCARVVTPLVYISENTWKFSFGKFLESFFYNRDVQMNSPDHHCSCDLQTSTTLFFGCGRLAARFTYERVRPFGVFVRRSLPIDTNFHRAEALRQLGKISMASSLLFVKFDKHIEKVSREARSLFGSAANRPEHLQTVLMELNRIGSEVDHAAKTLQEKIASVSDKCSQDDDGVVNEALFRFPWFSRRYLFMLTSAWNEKLSAAGQAIVAMKKLASSASIRGDHVMGSNVPAIVGDPNTEELHEGMRRLRQLHEVYSRYNLTDITTILPIIPGNAPSRNEIELDDDFEDPDGAIHFADGVDADVVASRRRLYNGKPQISNQSHSDRSEQSGRQKPSKSLGTRRSDDTPSRRLTQPETIPNPAVSAKVTPGGAVKSAITRFFNRGGRESDPYVVELGIFNEGRPRLEPGVNGIVIPVVDEQLCTVIAYSLSSTEYANQFEEFSKAESAPSDAMPEVAASTTETASMVSIPDGAGHAQQRGRVNSKPPHPNQTPTSSQTSGGASAMSDRQGIERRMLVRNKSHIKHTFRDFDEKGQNLCKFVCTTYWATQFHAVRQVFLSSNGGKDSSGSNLFGLQCGLDVEQSFVQSLSSAYSWAASGGKSGASFARTSDDRFVIKCISRTELQMFLDCAPAYFEYLSKAFFHGLPTVLCKIVGVYQIGYHNRVTGKRSMEQVAVMQNIFYNRKITKTFDLKGSLRGRFAAQVQSAKDDIQPDTPTYASDATSGYRRRGDYGSDSDFPRFDGDSEAGSDIEDMSGSGGGKEQTTGTLLDGDFLEFTSGRPMPMNDRAKAVFHMSILNDTLFLSIINVLDYSILVGIDEERMELVVGIIDFMRQYDILKQMERVGKSLPMVVGSEAPTIIQPPLYKARFTNAMERYFMTVPSKWTTI